MKSTAVVALALGIALVGCGKKNGTDAAVQDSAGRDLSLAPADSSTKINDRPQVAESSAVAVPPPAATSTPRPPKSSPAPAPAPAPSPPPAASPAPAPAPSPAPAGRSVDVGTTVALKSTQEWGTKTHKVGQTVTATVADDIKDDNGRTVIPAGSTVTLEITQLAVSENKDDSGKVALRATSVSINGVSHPLDGVSSTVEHGLKGRGVKAGDAAKVGAGAAAGAVVGKVIGKGKGAVIGGVIGAAAGTAVAINSADRDVIVPVGGRIVIKLTSAYTGA
jgi:hypothetical protein